MQTSPLLEGVNIVVLGQFNPAIFHPAWFAAEKLVRPQEAESAEIQLVHPEAAVLRMEWLQLNVVRDRFQASTLQSAYAEPLRDLVAGVFSLLSHTPLTACGINHEFHFRLESEAQWHALGDRLAPKSDWGVLQKPGLRSLVMEGQRDDGYAGYVQVRLEPSPRYEHSIFVHVNDHYDLRSGTTDHGSAERLIQIMNTQWAHARQVSIEISEKLLAVAAQG